MLVVLGKGVLEVSETRPIGSPNEGGSVAEFTIEIPGQTQDQFALELSTHLNSSQENMQAPINYSERDLDPVNGPTIVSVVTSASQDDLQVAESIWDWWQSRRLSGNKVTIRIPKGRVIDLSLIDQKQLEIALTEMDRY
jgi:hypothetical protein